MIFSNANSQSVLAIHNLLQHYSRISGQLINFSKSGLFFSSNVSESLKYQLASILQISSIDPPQQYLGLPSCIGISKTQTFSYIIHRIQQKLKGWKEKFLSMGGKEVLIKAIIAAIPICTMMCFKLPLSLCNKINQMTANYWWGQQDEERKIHWVGWNKLCQSKWSGGLGFKDLICFNQALLAKQAWRLFQSQDTLLFKVLQSKYFPHTDLLKASIGKKSSWGWRSLQYGMKLLKTGLRWQINSGKNIICDQEPWVPTEYPFIPTNINTSSNIPIPFTVAALKNYNASTWNTGLIKQIFTIQDAEAILSIPLPLFDKQDRLLWHYNSSGIYTVKSGYHLALKQKSNNDQDHLSYLNAKQWQYLWKLHIPTKIKNFLWRAISKGLPSGVALQYRTAKPHPCIHCGNIETISHMLFLCPAIAQVWFISPLGLNVNEYPSFSFSHLWILYSSQIQQLDLSNYSIQLFCFLLWHIWKARNEAIFNHCLINPFDICNKSVQACLEFADCSKMLITEESDYVRPSATIYHSLVPSEGTLKINYDAASYAPAKFGTMGFIVSDYLGRIIARFTAYVRHIWDPGILEWMALRTGLSWAISKGWKKVIFEGDALQIPLTLNHQQVCSSNVWGIWLDILHLQEYFQELTVIYIPRMYNSIAHNLAQSCKKLVLSFLS